MFENIASFCKYIYEKISIRFNTIVIDHRQLLEEDTHYRRMVDGDFYIKKPQENESFHYITDVTDTDRENKIKERMDNYKK